MVILLDVPLFRIFMVNFFMGTDVLQYLQSRVLLGAAPSSPNAGMPSPVSRPVVSAHVSSHVTLGNLYLVKQTIF